MQRVGFFLWNVSLAVIYDVTAPRFRKLVLRVFSGGEGKRNPSLCSVSRHNYALTTDDPESPTKKVEIIHIMST